MATQEIPTSFQTGITVLKWPEEVRRNPTPSIRNLSVDPKGFYLICQDEFKTEIECFDLALIHDTRTGTQVTLPQGAECINDIKFGMLDTPITSKWVSIYYGNTFVVSNELRIIHFYFRNPSLAREWAEQLFRLSRNPRLKNLSCLECLEKIHSKIIHGLVNSDKKIPIQSLIQYFCRNTRDDSKDAKIRHALEFVKITSSLINLNEFTFKRFFRIYMYLMDRREVERLFGELGGRTRRCVNLENLTEFLKNQSETSHDPSGVDYGQKAKHLIGKYSHNQDSKENEISDVAFFQYLLSSDSSVIDPKFFELHMDMNKPLSHYFIASSHNTYLAGSQLTGRASIEMYRQVLLTGCRCIELDVLDSENDEPEIKHIYTPIRPIRFIDVIVAIRDYAFKVTSYPLVLSVENHCNPRVQAKMAQFFVEVFGEDLLIEPLDSHPCEENYPLPSPNDLRRKILIKNKKLQPTQLSLMRKPGSISNTSSDQSNPDSASDEMARRFGRRISQPQKTPREGVIFDNEDFSDDDKPSPNPFEETIPQAKATAAMSDLVNYMVPVRFTSFASAEIRNRSYEMSSFPEDKAQTLIRDQAKDFLNYNRRQLCRIYPRGTRFESSNYNPYIFWPIGCQMVALNYQTLDIPMQINLALFSFNGICGYIEKPSALCQPRSSFDPKNQTNVENTVSYQIDLKVISGQFLCQDREPTFVDVQMYGIYGQPNKRCEYRIRAKGWNGFQANYDDSNVEFGEFTIQFPKIVLPEMAALRFSVTADDGTFLGQSFIPIAYLRPGYRHVVLRNLINVPVNSSSLFIYIRKKMSMSARDQEFADKLAQPLMNESSNSSNEFNQSDDSASKIILRKHHHHPTTMTNHAEYVKKQNSLGSTDEMATFSKHVIAGSELNDKKRLCKVLSLNDIHPKEISERNKTIQQKLRRISVDFQPQIQKEELRFREGLNSQNSHTSGTKHRSLKDIEQSLLKLYSDKCHQQEELEQRYLNEYYKRLEKELTEDHNRQLNQIQNILKREKARVNEQIQSQIKRESNEIPRTEPDKEKVRLLKQKSLEKHSKVGEVTLQMLEDMHEQAKEILQINLQINLLQLEEEKTKEVNTCLKRYSDGFSRIQAQILQHQNAIYSSEILSERF